MGDDWFRAETLSTFEPFDSRDPPSCSFPQCHRPVVVSWWWWWVMASSCLKMLVWLNPPRCTHHHPHPQGWKSQGRNTQASARESSLIALQAMNGLEPPVSYRTQAP